jgi:hypothetical protein
LTPTPQDAFGELIKKKYNTTTITDRDVVPVWLDKIALEIDDLGCFMEDCREISTNFDKCNHCEFRFKCYTEIKGNLHGIYTTKST